MRACEGAGDDDAILFDVSTKIIEVDERTADRLRARAAELGLTVSDLVAELAAFDADAASIAPEDVAELDRRWKKIEQGERSVPQAQVVKWLRTWGAPGYRPWRPR